MDANDRIDQSNRQRLRHLLANLPSKNVAFIMNCLCVPRIEGERWVTPGCFATCRGRRGTPHP
jgi:hypothetical protein